MHPFSQLLLEALHTGSPVKYANADVPATEDEALSVQAELMEALGGEGAWKVSPWSEGVAMWASPIPRAWIRRSGDQIAMQAGLRLEVEFALLLESDGSWQIAPAFELVTSRIDSNADWPELAKRADLHSSAGVIVGKAQPLPVDPAADRSITLTLGDGTELHAKTILSRKILAEAAQWLLDHAANRGLPLRPGTTVMTGARMGPMPFPLGITTAHIDGMESVSMTVGATA